MTGAPVPTGAFAAPLRTRPRRSVLSITAVVALIGALLLVENVGRAAWVFAPVALLAFALCVLTALIGWWILRRLSPLVHADARGALLCLLWGAIASAGFAPIGNDSLQSIYGRLFGIEFRTRWGPALAAPLNEELLKLCGLVLLGAALLPLVRGPLDGFTFGAFVGLGFQVTENWLYAVNGVIESGGTGGAVSVIDVILLRVGVTGLSSHWVMSAIAGTGLGFLVTWRGSTRRAVLGEALIGLAMLLHLLFDSPLVDTVTGLVIRGLLNFAVGMTCYVLLRRRFHRAAVAAIVGYGAPAGLLRRRRRRAALRRIPAPAARAAARADQERLLIAVADTAHRTL